MSLEDVAGPALRAPTFTRTPGDVSVCAGCGAHERFHVWRCERCARRLEPSGDRAHLPVKLCAACPGAGATLYCLPSLRRPHGPSCLCNRCGLWDVARALRATPGVKKAR